jgi:hypothetical protein
MCRKEALTTTASMIGTKTTARKFDHAVERAKKVYMHVKD